ncbi:hypothetical protein PG988_013337 [Apiospora saccharicola]
MPVDAECFVIHPFQELVKIAKEAAANAEAGQSDDPERSKRMLKSARGLVKEGERALQKIQPLWVAQVDRHGDAFKNGIRDNGKLLHPGDSGDLLPSPTYLEADSLIDVDVENRRILEDLLYDLDDFIEVDTFDADKYSEVQAASKAFALSALEAIRRLKIKGHPSTPQSPSKPMTLTSPSASTIFPPLPPLPAKRIESFSRPFTAQPIGSSPSSTSPSRKDSQRTSSSCTSDISASRGGHVLERMDTVKSHASSANSANSPRSGRSSISSRRSDQPPLHPGPLQPARSKFNKKGRSSPIPGDGIGQEITHSQAEIGPKMAHMSSTPRISEWVREQLSTSLLSREDVIPENGTLPHRNAGRRPATRRSSRDASVGSELPDYDSAAPTIPGSTSCRTSVYSESSSHLSTAKGGFQVSFNTTKIPPLPARFFNVFPAPSPETPPRNISRLAGGVKAVSHEYTPTPEPEQQPWYADRDKCTIGTESSFKVMGGFCEGAFIFREGGGQAATIAGLEQEGRTPCESDATVFTTPEQLFRHLARHPQPLPELGEFPVAYGEPSPADPEIGKFDLIFPNPQTANPLTEVEPTTFESLPTAVATMDHLVRPGDRMNVGPDGEKTLQFLEGARILGVEFPEKWGGKQCVGWHDGARGSFPVRCISLFPPLKGNVRIPGMNNDGVTVTTRWKWEPSDPGSGWLSFDKGATIRNVSWLDQNQWCWSGMTKDGKVGFFPQSHIKPESVKEALSPESNQFLRQVRPTRLFNLRRTLSHAA